MVEGQTGLSIKDYPFAFSIAALFFPNLLNDTVNSSTQILGILLIGGMLGSLLTIINPLSLIIKERYRRSYSDSSYHAIFQDVLIPHNHLLENIVKKNMKTAISSPSISFEIDKTVAMLYFVIILTLTIIRSFIGGFTDILNNNQPLIWSITAGVIMGLIGVSLVLINHAFGFKFKFTRLKIMGRLTIIKPILGVSQFDRICYVTIANMAIDLANLSNEGVKWGSGGVDNQTIRDEMLRKFFIFNKSVEEVSPDLTASYSDFESALFDQIKELYQRTNTSFNQATIDNSYQKYKSVKEITWKYEVMFSEALSWFANLIFFNPGELYEMEPQLRTLIESRDWNTAELTAYRITDKIETVLRNKKMPALIDNKWNLK